MSSTKGMGIPVEELNDHAEATIQKVVENFFRKRTGKAFRGNEIITYLEDYNPSSVRRAMRELYYNNKLKKKMISSNKSYYYWNSK